jgi:hypothetical protein
MRPLLGELLAAADEHIDAAASSGVPPSAGAAGGAVRELARVTAVMARFAVAFVGPHVPDPGARPDSGARAVLDAWNAVHQASVWATIATGALGDNDNSHDHPAAVHLAAATSALGAGHDLMQAHFAPGRHGSRLANSPWAPLVASPLVTAALIGQIAGQARRLAPWAIRLSTTPALPAPTRAAVGTTSQWLLIAEGAAWALAQHDQHPTATMLLHAIPANTPPPRQRPSDSEPVPAMCTGIAATAERLRHLAYRRAADMHPAARITSVSWQQTAQAGAITAHSTELILRSLAQPGTPGTTTAAESALRQAAVASHKSWTAWRIVTRAWDTLTTGPAVTITPTAAEISDLVLWTGKLARQNPAWTPTCRHASPGRHPAGLAAEITNVLAALRDANDALTRIAAHDHEAVGHTATRGGLFVPRSLLPDWYEPPHRYAPAPHPVIDTLLAAYDTTIKASASVGTALWHVADELGCTPTVQDALQAAASLGTPYLTYTSPSPGPPMAQPLAGQIELALHQLHISEPRLLGQARNIDGDTQQLLTTVTAKLRLSGIAALVTRPADDPPNRRHHPARLAGLDTPRSPSRTTPPQPAPTTYRHTSTASSATTSAKRGI